MVEAGSKAEGLRNLPPELLLQIFSYLPAATVWKVLRQVCRYFNVIINDDKHVWLVRLQRQYRAVHYPPIVTQEASFSYVRACCEIERERNRWVSTRPPPIQGPDFMLSDGHTTTVDVVHLVRPHGRLCLSGSRDRSICIWDLEQLPSRTAQDQGYSIDIPEVSKAARICTQEQAHKGWIWCITSLDEHVVYSGGWDCHVNRWQLTPTGLEPISNARLNTAVLSVIAERELVLASSFDHRVTLLDPRDNLQRIAELHYHRGPVLSMVKTDHDSPYIYTCGQDRKLFCLDRRTWTPIAERTLTHYAHSLSYAEHQLWAATQGGTVALINPYSDKLESIVEHPVAASKTVVRQVQHSLGSTLCMSKDRKLRIFSPGVQLNLIAESGPFHAEPGRVGGRLHTPQMPISVPPLQTHADPFNFQFDFAGGNLAMAYGDGSVGIWHSRFSQQI